MRSIWETLPRPFFALAPMEAVSDTVFRRVVAHAAKPDLFFSEFTNATGWVHAGDKAIGKRLVITDGVIEQPLLAQIWGSIPEDIAKLAQHCKTLGYHGIDINMGCPESSAVKSGGGAGMIRTPELAADIIAAAKTAGLPVSVKTRLGYSQATEWPEWLGYLLEQDIAALTVHLRSKKEMSKVPAHWELVPEIVALRNQIAPKTLLLGNGDVANRQDGEERLVETGLDGIVIGRGVFTNIFAFSRTSKTPTQKELLALLNYHLDLYEAMGEGYRPFETLKRFFKVYIRDFAGSGELRVKLMETTSVPEARQLIKML